MRQLALVLAAGLLVAGCGGASAQTKTGPAPRVTLKLTAPDDGRLDRNEQVEVRGTVSPADSTVQVAGEDADVEGGEFRAEITLNPGQNIIDISASSPGRRPATDAVRVTRDMRVPVPQLVGLEVEQATEKLAQTELKSVEEQGGSWLDRVIPGTDHVCAAEPAEGTLVDRETTVTLLTRRDC